MEYRPMDKSSTNKTENASYRKGDFPGLKRTDSMDPDFRDLVRLLDAELAVRDGSEHAFYHQFNGLEGLDRVVIRILDGRAVACGAMKLFDADSLEVKRMFTRPENRGQGMAGWVLRELEAWAAEDGFRRIVLETGKRQPEAIALYEKYGYRRIQNFGPYIGIENSVCFEKRFTN